MPSRLDFARAVALTTMAGLARPLGAQTGLVTLRIGTNAADDVTPLLWAKATGMFAKAGIDADVQKFTSGSAVTAAVIGGSLDPKDVQPLIDVALKYGVIDKPMRAETMISSVAVRPKTER